MPTTTQTISIEIIEQAALDAQFLIVKGHGMATKSLVEDFLMARFGIDRFHAHDVMNGLERRNVQPWVFSGGKTWWNQAYMMRPEPQITEYPDLKWEVLF